MLTKSKLLLNLVNTRCLATTPRSLFKFKLTEELSRQFEEGQKKKLEAQEPPETALHTRESSLIMGRVSHDHYEKVIKVAVPKYRLNEFLMMYVKEKDDIQAYDENLICKPGDWILLRRLEKPIDEGVEHKVEKVVFQYGKYIDPTTGRRSLGLFYDDEIETLEQIKLEL